MMEANVTIEKSWPPETGAKSGGFKANDGRIYKVKTADWRPEFREGSEVAFEFEPSEYNGKTYLWFKNMLATREPPASIPINTEASPGDVLRFVSNVVGSAIATGRINDAYELGDWAKAAYRAYAGMHEQQPSPPPPLTGDDDGDPVPF